MRFAYADPPYVGQARKHYGPDAKEVNHPLLIAHLQEFDGWALSLSTPSLSSILPMCPDDARVCAWVKPFAAFKKHVTQAYAWEPVIVRPLRRRPIDQPTVRDWVSTPITLQRGVSGAKPEAFCRWLFAFAGLTPDDEFVDLFPRLRRRSAGVGRVAVADGNGSRRVTADWRTRELPFVTLIEAADELGITAQRLRAAANQRRNGDASDRALAGRLGIFQFIGGRDWMIPRDALLAEIARRGQPSAFDAAIADPATKAALDAGLADLAAGRVSPWTPPSEEKP